MVLQAYSYKQGWTHWNTNKGLSKIDWSETEGRGTMESIALFEEKVPLHPRDFQKKKDQTFTVDSLLQEKLVKKLEGKCSLHGWVLKNSVKILSRSMGYVESGRFTGDIVFHVQAEGKVYNPPSGQFLSGVVTHKNMMGMYVDYNNAIRIILPRDLHIGNEEYDTIEINDKVDVIIKKSRFQVNDPYILSVGLYMGKEGSRVQPRTLAYTAVQEEEEEEEEEEQEQESETQDVAVNL
jgi:DNA-directed RNA polymerase subunit E'/Rpb7